MMVTGFREIDGFREFHLRKQKNAHSVCTFTAGKGTCDVGDELFLGTINVYDCPDTDTPPMDALLMTGILQSVKCIEGYSEDRISVSIISRSVMLEKDIRTRIFQSREKTCRDIFEYMCRDQEFQIICLKEDLREIRLEQPFLQIGETDMEFLCRIASQMDASVWIDDESDGIWQVRIGDRRGAFAIELDAADLMVLERELCFDEERLYFRVVRQWDGLRSLDIGRQVKIRGKRYTIEEVNIDKQGQEYRYEYLASRRMETGSFWQQTGTRRHPVGHFTGTVTDNRDPENRGRVQVDFNSQSVEDIADDDRLWICVAAVYAGDQGGILFIPDKGDLVDVLWDGREFLVTGVRRTKAISEAYRNVDEKRIVDGRGRSICFGEKGLLIRAGASAIQVRKDKVVVTGRTVEIN